MAQAQALITYTPIFVLRALLLLDQVPYPSQVQWCDAPDIKKMSFKGAEASLWGWSQS